MKMKVFSSGSAVVVDKMKRRRVPNAIRNFIWVDGKNEAASTIVLYYLSFSLIILSYSSWVPIQTQMKSSPSSIARAL
jgi:uncharacterized membrane protein